METAISYGTYYKYMKPGKRSLGFSSSLNIEPDIQVFADGEISVKYLESIRGKRLFIFGDTVHHLEELVMTINAARRSSAAEINVVMPYYGYCRQDKRGSSRGSLGAEAMATILLSLGMDRLIVIDLHSEQIQLAFPSGKVEHLSGKHLFVDEVQKIVDQHSGEEVIGASPDVGGTVRVKELTEIFDLDFVIIDKTRKKANEVGSMRLIGDVTDKVVILRDDIVDTGGTLIKGVELLYKKGAKKVYVIITHPVCSNGALEKLQQAGINLITANTRSSVAGVKMPNVRIVNVHEMLLKAIINVSTNMSVRDLV